MAHSVKNNHDAPLGVAGVTIGAGKSVGIEANALRGCLDSNAIKQWIKLGLIEIEGLDQLLGDPVDTKVKAKAATEVKAKAATEVKIPGQK